MQNTIDAIVKEKIIVIVRGVEREDLLKFTQAVYDGGIRLIECTFDATGKVSDEQTAENIKMLVDTFGDKMLIGAGTVLKESQVELVKRVGGKFIISPDTSKEIIERTKELGLVSIPGALTPTEAVKAHKWGADFVKLFPVSALGSKYIKDVKAPLSHIRFLAVGGVNADNMGEFLNAGAQGFGIGSDIANKKLISEGKFDQITLAAKRYTEVVKNA